MDAANKTIINTENRKRLAELVEVYMNQSKPYAEHWAGLLMCLGGFSFHYFRTHLRLGEYSLYREKAQEKGNTAAPTSKQWYLLSSARNTDRMEDVLDQCVHFKDGTMSARVIGMDSHFNRILTEDGEVYELGMRITPPRTVLTKGDLTPALLARFPSLSQ